MLEDQGNDGMHSSAANETAKELLKFGSYLTGEKLYG